MKNASVVLLQTLGLAGFLAAGPLARGEERGFFFNGSLGGTVAENVKIKEFLGPASGSVKYDPGIHVGFEGGYNFNDWLGVGVESGVLANTIDTFGSTSPDAGLTHIPLLANAIFRYDREDFLLIPYFGVGVGGDSSVLWFNDSLGLDGSDTDFVFAYQFMAGVRFRINERMSAGVGYKYYHSDPASWDISNGPGEIRLGEANVHALSAVFTMKF